MSPTLPRELLDPVLQARDLHGLMIGGARGGLLADFLVALTARLPELEQQEAPLLAEACRDIVAACIVPAAQSKRQTQPQIDAMIYRRARRLIDANLHRPGWGAGELGAALGVSRSTFYRMMSPYGGVAANIGSRRLRRAHTLLLDSNGGTRIADIAARCGFASAAHFSRSFRQSYGYAPRDVIGRGHPAAPIRRHRQRKGIGHPAAAGLDALLKRLQPGDSLVAWKVDRLGRDALAALTVARDLAARGVRIAITTPGVDSSTPAGRMVLGVLAQLAEFERAPLIERTNADLAAARKRGIHLEDKASVVS